MIFRLSSDLVISKEDQEDVLLELGLGNVLEEDFVL